MGLNHQSSCSLKAEDHKLYMKLLFCCSCTDDDVTVHGSTHQCFTPLLFISLGVKNHTVKNIEYLLKEHMLQVLIET